MPTPTPENGHPEAHVIAPFGDRRYDLFLEDDGILRTQQTAPPSKFISLDAGAFVSLVVSMFVLGIAVGWWLA